MTDPDRFHDLGEPEPVALEITDVLDLHTFPPSEVGDLVRDYLDLAYDQGLRRLRIIHGKGRGVQRRRVRSILERDPRVVAYGDPPGEAGGWGATAVTMESPRSRRLALAKPSRERLDSSPVNPINWYLESPSSASGELVRTPLRPLPFTVGRRSDCDLLLDSHHGSQRHAELFLKGGVLWLRDLGSTNGTSVNGERITVERRMQNGDIVHFADREFRLVAEMGAASVQKTQVFSRSDRVRLEEIVRKPLAFKKMIDEDKLRTDFQPLMRLADGALVGYEVLGRGELDGHAANPGDLFFIAEKLQREVELSTAFRAKGLELGAALPGDPELFVNTHPAELKDWRRLLRSLELLRGEYPAVRLVLEIHEASITDTSTLRSLRSGLEGLGIGLAFDDFGTGQARLLELIEVAPRYLKFDIVLIEQLHLASRKRRDMVRSLVELARKWSISTIAECIESAEEAAACAEVGFEIGQGFHLGLPAPASGFA